MSTPNSIIIDGVEYLPVSEARPTLTGDIQIVVADRGWNFIGHTSRDDSGNLVISGAKVIRRWGTTDGLGQLALKGKQPNTILDEAGTVTIPSHAVIAVLDVNADKWS